MNSRRMAATAAAMAALTTASISVPVASADPISDAETHLAPENEGEKEKDRLNEAGTEVDREKVEKEVADDSDVDLDKLRKELGEIRDRIAKIKESESPAAESELQKARESLDKASAGLDESKREAAAAKKSADEKTDSLGSVVNGLYSFASNFTLLENAAIGAANTFASNTPIADAAEAKKKSNLANVRVSDAEVTVEKATAAVSDSETKVDSLKSELGQAERQSGDKQREIDDEIKRREGEVDKIVKEEQEKLDKAKREAELASSAAAIAANNATASGSGYSTQATTPAGPAAPSSVDTSSVVSAAMSRIGSPYAWGATGPSAFDCSGLVSWSYSQVGKSIPRTSQAQIAGGTPVAISDLQPGDVVGFYPGITHVGIYIGNGQVVHASTYGTPVQVADMNTMPVTGAARY